MASDHAIGDILFFALGTTRRGGHLHRPREGRAGRPGADRRSAADRDGCQRLHPGRSRAASRRARWRRAYLKDHSGALLA
jgi:hypothetical protein